MQSQQKRVKWSRGETAEALEERTDTGITQASVELMENCIPDIYGNVSRRPALKVVPFNTPLHDIPYPEYNEYTQVFPFYITENDFILVYVYPDIPTQLVRIKNGVAVYQKPAYVGSAHPSTKAPVEFNGVTYKYEYRPVSYAQQNNYMLIADFNNVYKLQIIDNNDAEGSFTPVMEILKFSAGWYAPNGTQTQQVNSVTLPNLAISGHFYNYTYTDSVGTTTVYSNTDTGIDGQANIPSIKAQIPVGSIIQLPNAGCSFRVEGYYTETDDLYFPNITFSAVTVETVPSSGIVCVADIHNTNGYLRHYNNGTLVASVEIPRGKIATVKCSASQTGYSKNSWFKKTNNLHTTYEFGSWEDASQADASVRMYGSLLTPVADENAVDSIISVEYGYESLQPSSWNTQANYPHPKKLAFHEQRLWGGAWAYSALEEYAIVLGSQIARYNDFKSDYNQENEPITLDILTQYKERILHLIDYNGLKIMTDAYEYAYDNGAGVKQSANGSLESCEPLVFDSLCMYVDSTGCQVKAMQYELQNNLFDSTTINQLAPHDLIWYPVAMAAYEDKLNSTGKYLFVVNKNNSDHPRVAVCNFVPGNQVNIWNRWSFPEVDASYISVPTIPLVHSVVHLKNGTLFMVCLNNIVNNNVRTPYIVPAVLDFDGNVDCEGSVASNNYTIISDGVNRLTLINTKVSVYSDGEFQWYDTTTNNGALTRYVSGLTNVTVGLPIESKIVSHPIDVGGKTKSIKKRVAKVRMSVHDTEPGAITINGKTGYMNPAKDSISFYGVTGMKNEIKYTLTNNNGAMFHLESLLMNIEYGTLDS